MANIKRVTINDISEAIGVSATTVYKALNNKPKVSEDMRKKIIKKAQEMNYRPNKLAQGLARGIKKIGIITPKHPESFMKYVVDGINLSEHMLADFNIRVILKQPSTSDETAEAAREMINAGVDGIILLANQVVPGIKPILDEAEKKDIPIAAIVSEPLDGTPLVGKIRSDGNVLGKMAAQFLDLCVDKKKRLVILIPQEEAVIHTECYESFVTESNLYKRQSVLMYKTSLEGDEANYNITKKIIESNKEVGGIYVASNNALGVCECIDDMDRMDISVIGHDIYPELANHIIKGSLKATLFQNQFLQAQMAVDCMFNYITGENSNFGTKYLRPELIMISNLECYKELY